MVSASVRLLESNLMNHENSQIKEILKEMLIFCVFSAMEDSIDGRERPETY